MSDALSILEGAEALGFVKNAYGSLSFRHPQCDISLVPKVIVPLVVLVGNFHCGRSAGYIEHDLPERVESLDQLKALLAYYLHRAMTVNAPEWLIEGRALAHLLPWKRGATR